MALHKRVHLEVLLALAIAVSTASQVLAAGYTYYDPIYSIGGTRWGCDIYGICGTQLVGYSGDVNYDYALLWNTVTQETVSLNPAGFENGRAYGTNGTQQVGQADGHALLWNSSPTSYVDLTPSGFDSACAEGISGSQQVGCGYVGGSEHALLWQGAAATYVDLNPSGFSQSEAKGVSGSKQAGWGTTGAGRDHALLWSGSAASYVDLNPTRFTETYACGIGGNQQVGYGYGVATNSSKHALLWNGTAASYVDLNPAGYTASYAYGTNGTQQAGYGTDPEGLTHALVWSGTAASCIDLGAFMPNPGTDQYWTNISAMAIDANGDVGGVGLDVDSVTERSLAYGILWRPCPGMPGDANLDRKVSFADYLILEASFGKTGRSWGQGDFNNDGKVSFADYLALEAHFGQAIPEPATLALLAVGGVGALSKRR